MVTRFQFHKIHFDIRYQQDMVISLYYAFIILRCVPIDLSDTLAGPESFVGESDHDPCYIETRQRVRILEACAADDILAERQCGLTVS